MQTNNIPKILTKLIFSDNIKYAKNTVISGNPAVKPVTMAEELFFNVKKYNRFAKKPDNTPDTNSNKICLYFIIRKDFFNSLRLYIP